ncbi:MAG: transposase [Phycisphaerae bacterium]|nr:transposase [Phycisphaerae bacterium]
MADQGKTLFKVMPLRILKPVGDTRWDALGQMLRDTRYRVYRLANLAISEAYLGFHLFRTGKAEQFKTDTIGQLSRRLRQMLLDEKVPRDNLDRSSMTGAVPDTVASGLHQYKIRSVTNVNKWQQVVRGKSSLPTFRADMAVPIRCDKAGQRRLERNTQGDVELDLMICRRPYPRVVLATGTLGPGQQTILDRLLENEDNAKSGYRQRLFEVKEDSQTHQWWLYVTYEFPAPVLPVAHGDIVVGIDLGVSVPLYAAINNGHARLGRRQFQALGYRIRTLQNQVIMRRRAIQRGGRVGVSQPTARSGHGVHRKLLPTEKLRRRIDKSYTTLNHQLSAAVIDFAKNHGAGVIQIEDLSTLKEQLVGTFLGGRWRYHQFQQFLAYKAKENGITLREVNPKYTSRRCSECGFIHVDFDRAFRDRHHTEGMVTKFVCPQCKYEADPDYNAARNIATLDIEQRIKVQCQVQKLM